jgi:hypothetical protein
VFLCAIIDRFLHTGRLMIALNLFRQHITYMRPGEIAHLTVDQLVSPIRAAGLRYQLWGIVLSPASRGMPGKTGVFDESSLIDFDLWLAPFLDTLVMSRDPKAALWTFSQLQLSADFMNAVRDLVIVVLHPSLYSNRHGGASAEDLLSRGRRVAEVKKRDQRRSENAAADARKRGSSSKIASASSEGRQGGARGPRAAVAVLRADIHASPPRIIHYRIWNGICIDSL